MKSNYNKHKIKGKSQKEIKHNLLKINNITSNSKNISFSRNNCLYPERIISSKNKSTDRKSFPLSKRNNINEYNNISNTFNCKNKSINKNNVKSNQNITSFKKAPFIKKSNFNFIMPIPII